MHRYNVAKLPENYSWHGFDLVLAKESGKLEVGDVYLGGRNSGFKLLLSTAIQNGIVHNDEGEYAYDLHECRKVLKIDGLDASEFIPNVKSK